MLLYILAGLCQLRQRTPSHLQSAVLVLCGKSTVSAGLYTRTCMHRKNHASHTRPEQLVRLVPHTRALGPVRHLSSTERRLLKHPADEWGFTLTKLSI